MNHDFHITTYCAYEFVVCITYRFVMTYRYLFLPYTFSRGAEKHASFYECLI